MTVFSVLSDGRLSECAEMLPSDRSLPEFYSKKPAVTAESACHRAIVDVLGVFDALRSVGLGFPTV
jgi:hypothetical protein